MCNLPYLRVSLDIATVAALVLALLVSLAALQVQRWWTLQISALHIHKWRMPTCRDSSRRPRPTWFYHSCRRVQVRGYTIISYVQCAVRDALVCLHRSQLQSTAQVVMASL
jgi:hypothetical protein